MSLPFANADTTRRAAVQVEFKVSPAFRPETTSGDSLADGGHVQTCAERFYAEPHYSDSIPYSDRQDNEIIREEPSLPSSTTGKSETSKHGAALTPFTFQRMFLSFCDVTKGFGALELSCVCPFDYFD